MSIQICPPSFKDSILKILEKHKTSLRGNSIKENDLNFFKKDIDYFINSLFYPDKDKIEFRVFSTVDSLEMLPGNLFTAVLMIGHYVPFSILEYKQYFYIEGVGQIYIEGNSIVLKSVIKYNTIYLTPYKIIEEIINL